MTLLPGRKPRTGDRIVARAMEVVVTSSRGWYFDDKPAVEMMFPRIWRDELRLPLVIPYDMAKRREVCAYAFEKLDKYIKWHEARGLPEYAP